MNLGAFYNLLLGMDTKPLSRRLYEILQGIQGIIYRLWLGLAQITEWLGQGFKALAGIKNGSAKSDIGDDMVSRIIMNDAVQTVFWNLVAVSTALLIFFTILKIIQDQYKTKDGGNPYMTVFKMFKGMLMFFFVTAAVLVGMFASGIVLTELNRATGGGATSVAGSIFKAMAYDANRKRIGTRTNPNQFSTADELYYRLFEGVVPNRSDDGTSFYKSSKVNLLTIPVSAETEPVTGTSFPQYFYVDTTLDELEEIAKVRAMIIDTNGNGIDDWAVDDFNRYIDKFVDVKDNITGAAGSDGWDDRDNRNEQGVLRDFYGGYNTGNGGSWDVEGDDMLEEWEKTGHLSNSGSFKYDNVAQAGAWGNLAKLVQLPYFSPSINFKYSPIIIKEYSYNLLETGRPQVIFGGTPVTIMGNSTGMVWPEIVWQNYRYTSQPEVTVVPVGENNKFYIQVKGGLAIGGTNAVASFSFDDYVAKQPLKQMLAELAFRWGLAMGMRGLLDILPWAAGKLFIAGVPTITVPAISIILELMNIFAEAFNWHETFGDTPNLDPIDIVNEVVHPADIFGDPVTIQQIEFDYKLQGLWSALSESGKTMLDEWNTTMSQKKAQGEKYVKEDVSKRRDEVENNLTVEQADWLQYGIKVNKFNEQVESSVFGYLFAKSILAYYVDENGNLKLDDRTLGAATNDGTDGRARELKRFVEYIRDECAKQFGNLLDDKLYKNDIAKHVPPNNVLADPNLLNGKNVIYKPLVEGIKEGPYTVNLTQTTLEYVGPSTEYYYNTALGTALSTAPGKAYDLLPEDGGINKVISNKKVNYRALVDLFKSDISNWMTSKYKDFIMPEVSEYLDLYTLSDGEVYINTDYWGLPQPDSSMSTQSITDTTEALSDVLLQSLFSQSASTERTVLGTPVSQLSLASDITDSITDAVNSSSGSSSASDDFNLVRVFKVQDDNVVDITAMNEWVDTRSTLSFNKSEEIIIQTLATVGADDIDSLMAQEWEQDDTKRYLLTIGPMGDKEKQEQIIGAASYTDMDAVYNLYDMGRMDYIVGFIGIFVTVGVYMNFTFGLIQRLLELGVLYVMSPLTIAFYPFDDGQRFNSAFVAPFYKKTIASYAIILSLNVFFIMFTSVKNAIELGTGGMGAAGLFYNVIGTIALISLLPKVRDIITNVLGADSIQEKKLGEVFSDAGKSIGGDKWKKVGKFAGTAIKNKIDNFRATSGSRNGRKGDFKALKDAKKKGGFGFFARRKALKNLTGKEREDEEERLKAANKANRDARWAMRGQHAKASFKESFKNTGDALFNLKNGAIADTWLGKKLYWNSAEAQRDRGMKKEEEDKKYLDAKHDAKEVKLKQASMYAVKRGEMEKAEQDLIDFYKTSGDGPEAAAKKAEDAIKGMENDPGKLEALQKAMDAVPDGIMSDLREMTKRLKVGELSDSDNKEIGRMLLNGDRDAAEQKFIELTGASGDKAHGQFKNKNLSFNSEDKMKGYQANRSLGEGQAAQLAAKYLKSQEQAAKYGREDLGLDVFGKDKDKCDSFYRSFNQLAKATDANSYFDRLKAAGNNTAEREEVIKMAKAHNIDIESMTAKFDIDEIGRTFDSTLNSLVSDQRARNLDWSNRHLERMGAVQPSMYAKQLANRLDYHMDVNMDADTKALLSQDTLYVKLASKGNFSEVSRIFSEATRISSSNMSTAEKHAAMDKLGIAKNTYTQLAQWGGDPKNKAKLGQITGLTDILSQVMGDPNGDTRGPGINAARNTMAALFAIQESKRIAQYHETYENSIMQDESSYRRELDKTMQNINVYKKQKAWKDFFDNKGGNEWHALLQQKQTGSLDRAQEARLEVLSQKFQDYFDNDLPKILGRAVSTVEGTAFNGMSTASSLMDISNIKSKQLDHSRKIRSDISAEIKTNVNKIEGRKDDGGK